MVNREGLLKLIIIILLLSYLLGKCLVGVWYILFLWNNWSFLFLIDCGFI